MTEQIYLPEYDHWDATALAEKIRTREISAADALRAAQSRVSARNPRLNAVIETLEQRAEKTLSRLKPAPFTGVPFLVKDLLLQLEGTVTTGSNRLRTTTKAIANSELADRFERSGLVIFGKTNTPEFGILGVTDSALRGPARNPWHLDYTPGGSSGGSAAAVAARIVPMAHGGDGGGSIRIPASACGLFGLKPSRGRVSSAPASVSPWSGFVQEHVLTRSVRDCAAMLDVSAGYSPGDAYTAPAGAGTFLAATNEEPSPCKIAMCRQPLYADQHDSACLQALEEAASFMERLGFQVFETQLPFHRREMTEAYLATIAAHTSRDIAESIEITGGRAGWRDFDPHVWMLGQIGRSLSASDLVAYQRIMVKTRRDMARFMAQYPLIMLPTLGRLPTRVGELDLTLADHFQLAILRMLPVKGLLRRALASMAETALDATPNTALFNQTGQPAMSVPLAWSPTGLPIGIQFAAAFGEEWRLISLATALERARPWAHRCPQGIQMTASAHQGTLDGQPEH